MPTKEERAILKAQEKVNEFRGRGAIALARKDKEKYYKLANQWQVKLNRLKGVKML
jgi:hypothetical protein